MLYSISFLIAARRAALKGLVLVLPHPSYPNAGRRPAPIAGALFVQAAGLPLAGLRYDVPIPAARRAAPGPSSIPSPHRTRAQLVRCTLVGRSYAAAAWPAVRTAHGRRTYVASFGGRGSATSVQRPYEQPSAAP